MSIEEISDRMGYLIQEIQAKYGVPVEVLDELCELEAELTRKMGGI